MSGYSSYVVLFYTTTTQANKTLFLFLNSLFEVLCFPSSFVDACIFLRWQSQCLIRFKNQGQWPSFDFCSKSIFWQYRGKTDQLSVYWMLPMRECKRSSLLYNIDENCK